MADIPPLAIFPWLCVTLGMSPHSSGLHLDLGKHQGPCLMGQLMGSEQDRACLLEAHEGHLGM